MGNRFDSINRALTSNATTTNTTMSTNVTVTGNIVAGSTAVVAVAPSTAGNVIFTTDGATWSSTSKLVSGTAVASTSGTSIDFTGIPSWVKRVTVMLSGVSTSGTSNFLIQIGNATIQTTGYASTASSGSVNVTSTAGFIITQSIAATTTTSGLVCIMAFGTGNQYIASQSVGQSVANTYGCCGGGNVALSGVLDRIRITTVNGTDTFDAGSINIMYE